MSGTRIELRAVEIRPGFIEQKPLDGAEYLGRLPALPAAGSRTQAKYAASE